MQHKLFGCKVNKYHLNQRLQYFSENNKKQNSSYIIIASCEVTDKAKNKYIKEIFTNINKGKQILLTGCGSISNGEKINEDVFYNRYPELKKHSKQITLLPESPPQIEQNSSSFIFHSSFKPTRKSILIQTGCDNYCTFCLTVRKRGPHRSLAADKIIQEINNFHASGGQEIVLTGINLAARGTTNSTKPNESKFSELLDKIISETEIPRIRISSLGPEYLDDKFFQIIQNPRFMNHFHISIQSFSDNILKSMKRNYDSSILEKVLNNFSSLIFHSSLSLGADIISGFPGETEEDFIITYDALEKYNITKLHAFPFSPHLKGETVPASFIDNQLREEIRVLRNKKLIQQGNKIRQNFINSQKGTTHKVLLEQKKNNYRPGRTENYIEIKVQGDYKRNQIMEYVL